MDQPSFYAVIPANVRYDKRLKPSAKLLYGEITALAGKEGFCWSKNEYFADLYEVSLETVSRWISQLVLFGYLSVEINKNEGNSRKIFINQFANSKSKIEQNLAQKNSADLLTKKSIPLDKKVNSYIRINNTINNTMNREENALAFFVKNCPSDWEVFQMKFKNQLSDFKTFCELFNAKCETEKLEFDRRVISGRLTSFAIHFVQNEAKNKKPVFYAQNTDLPATHHSRRKLD